MQEPQVSPFVGGPGAEFDQHLDYPEVAGVGHASARRKVDQG